MSYPQQPAQSYYPNQTQQQQPPDGTYQMNPSAPYAKQYPQQDVDYANKPPESGDRFNPKKRVNDIIPLILYLATVFGFAAVSGIALHAYAQNGGLGGGLGSGDTGSSVTLNSHTAYLLALVGAAALLLSIVYLMMVRAFTKVILEITLVLTVAFNVALCVYYWVIRYWSGAIIFTIIAIVSVLSYWGMRSRIPLTRILLQTVIDISKHHPSVYGVCIIALLVQTALSVWYAFTLAAVYVKWTPDSSACSSAGGSCSSGKVAGLAVFCTFAYLWMSQVIANIALMTLAGGPYGGWYYYGPSEAYGGNMPKHPCFKAFVRASTLSLGSVAFGSLIVTILELLRMLLNIIQQNAASDGDMVGQILACVAGCCISCITGMVEWFNRYAYIEIALYGKPYIPAARDAWALMKDRGIDALVNDSLVGMVFKWGAYAIAVLCAAFGYLYLRYTHPSYNSNGDYSPVIILYSFLIGFQSGLTLAQALEGGVSTIFVCLGEDPGLLAQRNPVLFEEIRQKYPRVVQGIPNV